MVQTGERIFRAALATNPRAGDAHQNLGTLLMERANVAYAADEREAAERLAREAVEHFDASIDGEPRGEAVVLLLAGRILLVVGEPRQAAERLRRFVGDDMGTAPQREEARALLADAEAALLYAEGTELLLPRIEVDGRELHRDANWRAAVQRGVGLLEEFVVARPDNAAAHWFLGKGRAALGDDEGAYASLARAAGLPGATVDYARELSLAALRVGRFDEGVRAARAAVAQSPDAPDLRANLALALLLVGDIAEARSEIERAHHAAPADATTGRLRERILAVHEGRAPRPSSLAQLERD